MKQLNYLLLFSLFSLSAFAQTIKIDSTYFVRYFDGPINGSANVKSMLIDKSDQSVYLTLNYNPIAEVEGTVNPDLYSNCVVLHARPSDALGMVPLASSNLTNLVMNYPLPIVGSTGYVCNLFKNGGVSLNDLNSQDPANKTSIKVNRLILPGEVSAEALTVNATAVQTDGKIVLVGECNNTQNQMIVIRLNADYSFDTSFHSTGFVKLSYGTDCKATAVAITSDSKIVVAGHQTLPNSVGIVVRLDNAGALDKNFGTKGTCSFNYVIQTTGDAIFMDQKTEVRSMTLDSLNNIYVGGIGAGIYPFTSVGCFAKINVSGIKALDMLDVDHTHLNTDFMTPRKITKILLLPDTGILLAGSSGRNDGTGNTGLYLQKFNSIGFSEKIFIFNNSAFSTNCFNLSSTRTSDIINDMALLDDGSLMIAGQSSNKGFYTRLLGVSPKIPAGIKDIYVKNQGVSVYMDQANSTIHVKISSIECEKIAFNVYDTSGRLVESNKAISALNDISIPTKLSKGMYVGQLKMGNRVINLKFKI